MEDILKDGYKEVSQDHRLGKATISIPIIFALILNGKREFCRLSLFIKISVLLLRGILKPSTYIVAV